MSTQNPEWDEWEKDWRSSLAANTDEELMARLNREVGNNGWVSVRGLFLRLLRAELTKRYDLSGVEGLDNYPGRRKFALEEGRLVYADTAGAKVLGTAVVPISLGPAGAEVTDAAAKSDVVVYGVLEDESLVFMPEARARVLAEVVDAFWSSATYGELRARLERAGTAAEFLDGFGYPDDYPDDDEEIDEGDKDAATQDGDWPAWPGAEQLRWMPKDVIGLGDTGDSMVSGPAVWFEPKQEDEVVAALARHGFACRRDDALVAMAAAMGQLGWKDARRQYDRPVP